MNNGNKLKKSADYLHLGGEADVHTGDIIGIFDMERVTVVRGVNDFFKSHSDNGTVTYVSDDLPKSFVVTDKGLYVCGVGTQTLKRRVRNEIAL